MHHIAEPTVRGMAEEGMPFKGVLYIGLMMTARGPQVLEFNARFGDPETQAILMRLESDLVDALEACVDGRLAETELRWSPGASACVVASSGGYPGSYKTGLPITGLDCAAQVPGSPDLSLRLVAGGWPTGDRGGRVLGVTAAARFARTGVGQRLPGAWPRFTSRACTYRRDIGHRALTRKDDTCALRLKNSWPGTRSLPISGRHISTLIRSCLCCPATSAARRTCRSLCGISGVWSCAGGSGWPVCLRWRGKPMPAGPLDALFDLHIRGRARFSADCWTTPAGAGMSTYRAGLSTGFRRQTRKSTRRKVLAHTLFHSQRHWAQLATLVAPAGFPSGFKGDLLLSSALDSSGRRACTCSF